ncbi:MAG: hypothetical protein ABSC03_16700 [Verrucomicrobiota bacterium]|jgi:hypothetical protein
MTHREASQADALKRIHNFSQIHAAHASAPGELARLKAGAPEL